MRNNIESQRNCNQQNIYCVGEKPSLSTVCYMLRPSWYTVKELQLITNRSVYRCSSAHCTLTLRKCIQL